MSSRGATSQTRGVWTYVIGGCAVLGLCALCAALAGAGYLFTTRRQVTLASAPSVEYILDATARMAKQADGETDTRLNVARGVLAEIVRPSDPTVTAGLRVFGTGAQPVACSDTNLVVPLAPSNQGPISTNLLALTAGTNADAAMSQAMIAAIRDLAPFKGKHTLVVVTGGADSCNPQAGALIASEARKAGIDLQLFLVGYQVPQGDGDAIKTLVDGAGGNYIESDTKNGLIAVLTTIQSYAQSQGLTNTTTLATAAAAVGTQNVVVATTPQAAGTPAVGPTPNPGATAAATAAATAPPTANAQGGGGGSGGTGQTACDHPYFPMRAGATWNFSGDAGGQTWTISGVTGDKSNATASMQFKTADVTGTYHWSCSADGIDSYDFGSVSSGGSAGIDFTVLNHTGTFLLSADRLLKGAAWDNAYSLEGTVGGVSVTDNVSEHFTVAGTETITVGDKKYDALRIDVSSTYAVTGGSSGSTSFNGTSSYWLVQGIGPVQWQSTFGSSTSTATLTSYSIP